MFDKIAISMRLILFVLLPFLISSQGNIQIEIDSLNKVYERTDLDFKKQFSAGENIVYRLAEIEPERCIEICQNLCVRAIESKDSNNIWEAYTFFGLLQSHIGNDDDAYKEYLNAASYAQSKFQKAKTAADIGGWYYSNADYSAAYESLINSNSLLMSSNLSKRDSSQMSENLSNLGLIYTFIEDDQKAIKKYKMAFEYFEMNISNINAYSNYVDLLIKNNNIFEAKKITDKMLGFASNSPTEIWILLHAYLKKGDIAIASEKYDEASSWINKAYNMSPRIKNPIMQCELSFAMGKLNILKDEPYLGLKYLEESYALFIKNDLPFNYAPIVLDELYKTYKLLGLDEKAYNTNQLLQSARDSIKILDVSKAIYRDEIHDLEHKYIQDSIALQNKNNSLTSKNTELKSYLDKFKNRIWLFIILIVLILITIVYRIFYLRRKFTSYSEKMKDEIKQLKKQLKMDIMVKNSGEQQMRDIDETLIKESLGIKLNDTDVKILKTLIEDPSISNKGISEKIYISYDGVRSSLKKMYAHLEHNNNLNSSNKSQRLALVLQVLKTLN